MKRVASRLAAFVFALVVLAAIACSDHTLTGVANLVLSISPDSTTLVAIGDAPRVNLTAQDMSGNPVTPGLVHWVSSDPSIVEVAQDGTIVAARNGTATITAFVSSAASARTVVTVNASVDMEVAITAVSTRPIARIADTVSVLAFDTRAPDRLRTP